MITKTYQALNYQTYDMYVMVEGKKLLIPFRGGTLKPKRNGIFQTSDPKLQESLAKDTSNGISYKEIGSFDDEAKPEKTEGTETKDVPGITTVQDARQYLIDNIPGMTANALPNKTVVMAIAEQNKIVFTDLK